MTGDDPILIRPFNPAIRGEEAYLLSNWLRDLRASDPSGLPDTHWFAAHRAHIADLLRDPGVTALVAADAADPEHILGFAVARPREVLEWIQVKRRLRGTGLARRLLEAADVPPGTPARFRTADSHRIRCPWRPRQLRRPPDPART